MADTTEWLAVIDEIHDSLAHGLNGRLAGLSGIVQVARMRGAVDEELLSLLDDELSRLQSLARLTASVPRSSGRGQPLTAVSDALSDVHAVALLHKQTLQVEQPSEAPVVRVLRDDLSRSMLLAIRAVGAGNASIRVLTDQDGPVVRIVLGGRTQNAAGAGAVVLNTRAVAEAERLLSGAGTVAVGEEAGSATVELRLPLAE